MRISIKRAAAILLALPVMLLTASCNIDDPVIAEQEQTPVTPSEGYVTHVVINASRDAGTTRASYDETSRMLEFTEGDKLYVNCSINDVNEGSGYLQWKSNADGVATFEGDMTFTNPLTGTLHEFLSDKDCTMMAILFPKDYESVGCIAVQKGIIDFNKAFVAGSKAKGVEQLSLEWANTYNNGFQLKPETAVLAFTLSGLDANYTYTITVTDDEYSPSGTVTTDDEGVATFCTAFPARERTYTIKIDDMKTWSIDLTPTYPDISLGKKSLEKGYVYNVNRKAHIYFKRIGQSHVGKILAKDALVYDTKAEAEAVAEGNAVAMIVHAGTYGNSTDGFEHGLAIALSDETNPAWDSNGTETIWETANSVYSSKTGIKDCSWRLPNFSDWQFVFFCGTNANARNEVYSYWQDIDKASNTYAVLNEKLEAAGGTPLQDNCGYWTSTTKEMLPYEAASEKELYACAVDVGATKTGYVKYVRISTDSQYNMKLRVRAVITF